MKLQELRIRDFRNIGAADLQIRAPRLVILGPNGQGKTNLLEAVHLLCLTKAFRTHRLTRLIRQGSEGFRLEGGFLPDGGGQHRLRVESRDGGLIFELDGKQEARRTELYGRFPFVLLSPESMEISQGAPEERRRYLDRLLSLESPLYLDALIRYTKALKQRGRLLMQSGPGNAQLGLWEQELARQGRTLLARRQAFVAELEGELRAIYAQGFGEELLPRLEHRSNLDPELGEEAMLKAWREARSADAERGWCSLGPHRDDLKVTLDGRSLREFGSQGQHKLLMLGLALAEVRLLQAHTGESPLLLLDDLFGMLDDGRIRRIGEAVDPATQILISTTSPRHLDVIGGELQVVDCRAGSFTERAA